MTKRSRLRQRRAYQDARSGRFLPGNKASPGRPTKKAEERFLETVTSRCTPKRWARIVRRAVQLAEKGDAHARSWLSKLLNLDRSRVEVDVTTAEYQAKQREVMAALDTLSETELKTLHALLVKAEKLSKGVEHDDTETIH